MMTHNTRKRTRLQIRSILKALCPACHEGKVTQGVFGIYPKCLHCGYNFHPESGFYLGAMAVSFFLTALLTVPPLIALKLYGAEVETLVLFPFVEFLFIGTFLLFYSRILWLHLEYTITEKLE